MTNKIRHTAKMRKKRNPARFLLAIPCSHSRGWESFRNYNPYHYCYNNPVSFKDPTGLAPEGEKEDELLGDKQKEDELQNTDLWRIFNESQALQQSWANGVKSHFPYSSNLGWVFEYFVCVTYRDGSSSYGILGNDGGRWVFGGGSDNGGNYISALTESQQVAVNAIRGGVTESTPGAFRMTDVQKAQVYNNIKVRASILSHDPDGDIATFWIEFAEAHEFVTEEILCFLTTTKIIVNLLTLTEFQDFSNVRDHPNAVGWSSYYDSYSIITLCVDILSNPTMYMPKGKDVYWYDNPNRSAGNEYLSWLLNGTDIVSHEFGHVYAYNIWGSIYDTWDKDYKENWAIYYCNINYREYHGRPIEHITTPWFGTGVNPPGY